MTKFLLSTAATLAVLASAAQAAENCTFDCPEAWATLDQMQVSAYGDATPYQSTPPVFAVTPRTPGAGGEAAPLGGARRPEYSAEASVPSMPATCPQPTEAEDKAECQEEARPDVKGFTISLPFFRFSIRLPGAGSRRHYASRPQVHHSRTQVARRSSPAPAQRVAAPAAPRSNTMDGE
jgi:hypothetical protein